MMDYDQIVVSCSCSEQLVRAINDIILDLPKPQRAELNDIFTHYVSKYGLDGAFDRMNDQSVKAIFEEFERFEKEPIVPVKEGEMDGIRYKLFDSGESRKASDG